MSMAQAQNVADYIITIAKKADKPITHRKLHQLLYFCQSQSLLNGNPLFDNDSILKWRFGPVVLSVYDTYKRYGVDPIHTPDVRTYLNHQTWNITIEPFDEMSLTTQEKELIAKTVTPLLTTNPSEMQKLFFKQPSWRKDREELFKRNARPEYTNLEILSDVNEHPDLRRWLQS